MDHDDDDEDDGGSGVQAEVLRSYLVFGARAVRTRKLLAGSIFLTVAALTVAVAILLPRTYHCETRIVAQGNQVLAARDTVYDAVRGASDLVLGQENLEAIVKQADLVNVMRERRPLVIRIKDAVVESLRGVPTEKDRFGAAVWTLRERLSADVLDTTLALSLDWPDPQSAAAILTFADDNFLEARHSAEVATIAEYAAILEGHATTLRGEVDTIADRIRHLREQARAQRAAKRKTAVQEHEASAPVPRFEAPRVVDQPPDEDLPRLKSVLEQKQKAISDLEGDRSQRLLSLQAKLADLQTKYTSAYPAVMDTQQSIQNASVESPQVAALRADVKDLEAEIARRGKPGSAPSGGSVFATVSAPSAAPLSADIMDLVQNDDDDLDPAVTAQLRYAIEKYTTLHTQISNARIDLDTAQAAFKRRYKITAPPEVPGKPVKPKVPLIVGIGLILGLLAALLVPIAAELRSGRVVGLWQVHQLALPILAELRFPPRPPE